ncbi:MAG TPA: phosphatidylglycerophosphatase A [Polyangia bacterium]
MADERANLPAPKGSAPSAVDRVAHVLAVWFGCGHMPVAPGHTGTLGAVPLYLLLRARGPWAVAAAAAILTAIGVWASGRVARRLGGKDPQIVVIDEVAGVLVTWVAAPSTWAGLIVGGLLFRLLDQLKPWPARAAERRLPGGWGIMLDDVFAGGWGAALLLAARALRWL